MSGSDVSVVRSPVKSYVLEGLVCSKRVRVRIPGFWSARASTNGLVERSDGRTCDLVSPWCAVLRMVSASGLSLHGMR